MKLVMFLMTLLIFLLLTGSALALSSDNYRLDWFTPLTGSGGAAGSAHYAVNFTIGQAAIGAQSSTHYSSCLGYWCGVAAERRIYLPLVIRNF